jgi:hypothetical protein
VGRAGTQHILDPGKNNVFGKTAGGEDVPIVNWIECAAYDTDQPAISVIGPATDPEEAASRIMP